MSPSGAGVRRMMTAGGDRSDGELADELAPAGQALAVAPRELQVVVGEADGAEADGDEEHDPDDSRCADPPTAAC